MDDAYTQNIQTADSTCNPTLPMTDRALSNSGRIYDAKSCIPPREAAKILRHHNVTSVDVQTTLICTNPLTNEG
ncbi:hypothetical protein [Pectobacterium carotovorum]|uniref:hypothetical protein n=1 Tax=Pectobacterium carotovorum TaxID=554 RepID=UPI002115D445|nr:hypothetical protein [Pectobacterium carotovorum]MCQ8232435.1 hypothetical protein [Pectobacterium carotovorum]